MRSLLEPAPGFRGGRSFTTPVIEMPDYLPYLVKRLEAAGGTLTRAALHALPNELIDGVTERTGVFNATTSSRTWS